MAVYPLIARGFGSWGGVNKIPTKGYSAAELIENLIRLSFTGYVLTDLSFSGTVATDLSIAGKLKNRLNLAGVFRQ